MERSGSALLLVFELMALAVAADPQTPATVFDQKKCTTSNGEDITCSWSRNATKDPDAELLVTDVQWLRYGRGTSLSFTFNCSLASDGSRGSCRIHVARSKNSCGSDLGIYLAETSQNVTTAGRFTLNELIPNPPADISASKTNRRQLEVTWSGPPDCNGQCSCTHLCAQMQYTSRKTPHIWTQVKFVNDNCYAYVNRKVITQLSPFTAYVIRMRLAEEDEWGPWSLNFTLWTEEEEPVGSVFVGQLESEQIPNHPYIRDVFLHWDPMDPALAQGIILGYNIHLVSPRLSWISNVTSFTIPGLNRFQKYRGWITAFNSAGESPPSPYFTIPNLRTSPDAPSINWNGSATSITLAINESRYPAGLTTHYTIEWQEVGTNERRNATVPFRAEVVTYTISELNSSTHYEVRVGAFDELGGNWSPHVSITTLQIAPVIVPCGFAIHALPAEPRALKLEWDILKRNISDSDSGYQVMYCRTGNGSQHYLVNDSSERCEGPVHILNITKADPSPFEFTGLVPYTRYSFRLRAINTAGRGPQSDVFIGRTAQGRPSPPLHMKVLEVTSSHIALSWSAPEMPNGVITRYIIKYNDESTETNDTQIVIGCFGYVTYDITVQSCNEAVRQLACSNHSSHITTVTTPIGAPSQPQSVTLHKRALSVLQVSWDQPTHLNGPLSHYVIKIGSKVDVTARSKTKAYTYTTTETEIEYDVDCGPDGHNVKEYTVAILAVNEDHGVELPGELAVKEVAMCGLSTTGSLMLPALLISVGVLLISCTLAFFIYRRCFRQSEKFDKIYFSDIVFGSKTKRPYETPGMSRPRHKEKEQFDVVQSQEKDDATSLTIPYQPKTDDYLPMRRASLECPAIAHNATYVSSGLGTDGYVSNYRFSEPSLIKKQPQVNFNQDEEIKYPNIVYATIIGISKGYSTDCSWKIRDN